MLPLCVVMLKSPVYMKKPKPQKLLSRVKSGVGLICSSVHTVRKGAGKCNPASLLCSGPQVTSSSEAMQEAEPQESLWFSSLGLDGNQNSSLGRNIWKRHWRQESKPHGWSYSKSQANIQQLAPLKRVTIGKTEFTAAGSAVITWYRASGVKILN